MIIDSGVVTGSLQVSGSLTVTGSLTVNGPITGAITGSVTSASYASFAENAALLNNLVSSSFVGTASFSTFSGSIVGRVGSLESWSSSLDATYATDASVSASITVLSSSVQASQAALSSSFATTSGSLSTRTTNLESTASTLTTASASFATVSASYASASGSLSTRTTNLESTASTLTTASASFATVSASYASASGSLSTRTTNLESTASTLTTASSSFATVSASYATTSASYAAASASLSTRVTTIEGSAATTSSNTFTGTQYISNTTNATGFTTTAALYTDGGLRVTKDAYVSGTAYFNNITVYGTSSVQYTTSSQANFGTNIINVNTATPTLRFGGYTVYDSGSTGSGLSGSLLWDSQEDRWVYTTPSGSPEGYASAILISGPPNTGALGSELGLTTGKIPMGYANDHIVDSIMSATGSFVYVTGSLSATNLTGSLNGSNLIAGSVANDRLTNSTISGIALGSNLATLTIGTGLSGTSYNGSTAVTIANTGVTAFNTRTGAVTLAAADISGLGAGIFSGSAQISAASVTNAQLVNSGSTITAGTGMSGGGFVALGGTVTLTNAGVTSAVAGTAISVSGATGAVTINNTGVTSNVAGTGVSVSGATGAVTISIGQAVATSSNVQFNSLGVGTAGSAVAGEIRATADVTAYYSSDERLKEDITPIENPVEKLMSINGVTFSWKEGFETVHSHVGSDTGVVAQQIEAINLPGVVTTRETGYMAVNYEKLNALLIEGFKAHEKEISELKALVNTLLNK